MSDEHEEIQGDGEVNADAIAEVFSDDHHDDDEDQNHAHFSDDEDEEEDWFDTNSEILDHDNHW